MKHLLFWWVVFITGRVLFLLAYSYRFDEESILEIAKVFYYSLKIDLAASMYLMGIPLFLIFVQQFFYKEFSNKLIKIYTLFFALIVAQLQNAELLLYSEWGIKIEIKALAYLKHFDEVLKTASNLQIIAFFALSTTQFFAFNYLYKKLFKEIVYDRIKIIPSILLIILGSGILIIAARGGTQPVPVLQSDAYFSKNNTLNVCSVNTFWNVVHSIHENIENANVNVYAFTTKEKADNLVQNIYLPQKDSTIKFLNYDKPNIVFIIFEGWSSDVIQSCGGDSGFTPNFEKIAEEGLLFTNTYASGSRSDQGMAAILSAFPSQPKTSIINQDGKYPNLPCINTELEKAGYSSSFTFGGQLSYENIKAYLMYVGFDKLTDIYDFDSSIPQGKLGVHDEFVYDRFIKELNKEKEKFFGMMFTTSTHSPFDMPLQNKKDYHSNENNYLNSIVYADSCLGLFFANAKKQKWYSNTLFVMVSDHSHNSHKNWSFDDYRYRKIPLLFAGNVIKNEFKGRRMNMISSQTDIAHTLLSQLNINPKRYVWSKNLMNPYTKPFAYYSCREGLGWVSEKDTLVYYYEPNKITDNKIHSANKDSVLNTSKAFLQNLFQQYLDF